jgi:hypothetical protein
MDLSQRLAQQLDAMSGERTAKITVRLTIGERQKLEERCQGISFSTYIRAGLFEYPMPRPRVKVPLVNRQMYVELHRIGVNLNQQTKMINALRPDEMAGTIGDYAQTLAALQAQIHQVKTLLVAGPEAEDDMRIEEG